ncbi:hypothetical protein DMN91_010569 [Ooceraea biroi]|uniref:Uncharacterized protein n=3 Tax=Ooceraea biroi TaxID=2015173 RepID=A0A3L8D898_OOCBI|nr:hypothetical protein DMN91_010569 [Ooceraea biroi]
MGFNAKNKNKIVYPIVSSVKPAKKGKMVSTSELRDPAEQSRSSITFDEIETVEIEYEEDSDFEDPSSSNNTILFGQDDLDDLVRDLGLPKDSSEVLASRLKERNMLLPGTKISVYRNRENAYLEYFTQDENLVYCKDVRGLINEFKPGLYVADKWRLFIDSSKASLKAVLLHNGNKYAAIPLAHSTTLSESYKTLMYLLEKIDYNEHNWFLCGDFKVINMILGLQSGFIKYPCFLCEWDSRARDKHWVQKLWPARVNFVEGSMNVTNKHLVDPKKILLPPLHIKLGLMKQFVKALNKQGKCFQYLQSKFRHLSDAKIHEGVFVGPDIRLLMKDDSFTPTMTDTEKKAWISFKCVVENFLGNNRDHNYKEIVSSMLKNFENLGCLMNMKTHFLFSHLDFFPENLGAFSEEHGERFHQDFKVKERYYQGRWDVHMMADYCWSLKRNESTMNDHSRKSQRRSFEEIRTRFHKKAKQSINSG